jgi:hypothetical protein
MSPRWGSTPRLTDWLSVAMWLRLRNELVIGWDLSALQLSEVTWSSRLASERVQLTEGSVESQPMKRRLGGWCEMSVSLGPGQLRRVLYRRLWQEDLSAWSWRIILERSRCQETASGDCNKLRTLVCVCQWPANCSSEWCIQGANNANTQSIPRL